MVMLFRAQTPCRGPTGMVGWRVQGEAKACVNVLNIVRRRHLQLWAWRGVKRASWEQHWGDKDMQKTAVHAYRALCGEAHCDYIMYKSKTYHKPRGIFSWPGLSLALNHKCCLHLHLQYMCHSWRQMMCHLLLCNPMTQVIRAAIFQKYLCLSVYLSICLSTNPPIHPSIHRSIHLLGAQKTRCKYILCVVFLFLFFFNGTILNPPPELIDFY